MDKEKLIAYITDLVIQEVKQLEENQNTVPVGISARHVHLSQEHVELLFGKGYKLTHFKDLSQPGQFAAKEQVELIGPKGSIPNVRILGPIRANTQVEVAASDTRKLGIKVPVRGSGDIQGTPGIILRGAEGEVTISSGVIVAERHLHMSEEEAKQFNVKDKDIVKATIDGPKGGVMGQIVVRVNKDYALDLHIDTDDANAFNLTQGQRLNIEK